MSDRAEIALVAGEASGDVLGAGLAAALRRRMPNAALFGCGGARMKAAGVDCRFDGRRLAVMGYWDAIRKLPDILRLRRDLLSAVLRRRPRVLVGIDAPDFNLGIEARARAAGIKTVHYVCPSVWMWRRERLHTIRRAADAVLCLFPFEPDICRRANIAAEFVGHPAADAFAFSSADIAAARDKSRLKIGIAPDAKALAILPGSRAAELKIHIPLFIAAARLLAEANPALVFIHAPLDESAAMMLRAEAARNAPELMTRIKTIIGDSSAAMCAADAVLAKSGTCTLEAALARRPMVVVYRQSPLAYWLARGRRRFYLPYFSLPNILCKDFIVPELIQNAASPAAIANAVSRQLNDADNRARLQARFAELHSALRQNAAEKAADAVARLAEDKKTAETNKK